MQQVETDQVNSGTEHSGGVAVSSPRPAHERCPHCGKFVSDVYLHTALEDCDVINKQISEIMSDTLKF